MWQVVSGTANLLNDRALQAVVPTITSDRRGFRSREGRAMAGRQRGFSAAYGRTAEIDPLHPRLAPPRTGWPVGAVTRPCQLGITSTPGLPAKQKLSWSVNEWLLPYQ
jgi:hypothetical protein